MHFLLAQGYDILRDGGEAMDAVVAAVTIMEGGTPISSGWTSFDLCCSYVAYTDCPLFNSGKGAVFNVAGKVNTSFQCNMLTESYNLE